MSGWNSARLHRQDAECRKLLSSVGGRAPLGKLVERPVPLWKRLWLENRMSVFPAGRLPAITLYCRLPYNSQVTPYLKSGKLLPAR